VTLGGQPVERHAVNFDVSSGAGSIRTVKDTTDRSGEARAVYTAGKKIGIVLITATDTTAGISGTVSIELRSDAPAKIGIRLDPEKLPADGRSRAELSVLVTDVNDNPTDNTEVEYAISSGGGRLQDDKGLTDRNGKRTTEYTAGRTAGTVTFEITVRSTVPTEAELAKARDLAVTVADYKFFSRWRTQGGRRRESFGRHLVFGLVALASSASWALGTVLWRKIGRSPVQLNRRGHHRQPLSRCGFF
jgi:hypothetical protein